jgi:prolyl oligopeptidase
MKTSLKLVPESLRTPRLFTAALLALSHLLPMTTNAQEAPKLVYPITRQEDRVEDYHGTRIADPYRWLEDDNSTETAAWVTEENKVTSAFLDAVPQRKQIKERLTKLWNFERFGVPMARGDRLFFMRNSGLQNQRVLYTLDRHEAPPRVLFDPNTLSADGTVSLAGYAVSDDGEMLAYGLSRAGSDWQDWHVREIATGVEREDLVEWVKFSGASWAKDGGGFFYSRYDAPKAGEEKKGVNEFQKLYFHKLGTKQEADTMIYERRDHPDWGFGGDVTDDGRFLILHVNKGTEQKNLIFYKDLADPASKVVELIPDFIASFSFIDNDGPIFFLETDLDAPRGRVIAIDIRDPARTNWREIVPQAAEPLKNVTLVHRQFICRYLQDAHSVVRMMAWDGKSPRAEQVRELALPGIGSVDGFDGRRGDVETFYSFTSFTAPGTIYRLNMKTGESEVFRQPLVDFKPEDYETKQVFFTSKDGTRVPMFITHKKGLALDGTAPTLLYGYGGFNISLTPSFSVTDLVWMEMGGVHAMPNLRGGGEYGIDWYLAGIKGKKQNVFDDFIASAEWLIQNKYTSSDKLAIQGGSNGGLLVGACMTQRPELFGAALPAVGVLDMLRFHKFTIGWAWKSDYGSSEDAEGFRTLLAYSPLHALKPGVRYPATLITTGDHDDRVVPAHSFKFAAQLQKCQAPDGPPVLIRIEVRAGHGAGKPMTKIIEEKADQLSFLVKVFGMNPPEKAAPEKLTPEKAPATTQPPIEKK